jgi:hypothetical protein
MRILGVIAVFIVLNASYVLAAAGDQTQASSSANTQPAPARSDELHFVNVLTFHGEIVAVDPAKRLVTLKDANGEVLTLEAERKENLAARKVGERVLARYFEGAQIGKEKPGEAAPVHSLKDGMIGAELGGLSGKQPAVAASVERVDAANQEITLEGSDGSLETIMVSNPYYLSHVKVGDQVMITRPQALALSLEKES